MKTHDEIRQMKMLAGLYNVDNVVDSNKPVSRQGDFEFYGTTQAEDFEYQSEFHKERLQALKTLFPRGHTYIYNIDLMVDIARNDQLNPLYEKALKEFEDAQLAMSRAANKLASAVKLVDSELLSEKIKHQDNILYNSSKSGIGANFGYARTAANMGATGPMGPPGMPGPQGVKGDPGPAGMSSIEYLAKMFFGKGK